MSEEELTISHLHDGHLTGLVVDWLHRRATLTIDTHEDTGFGSVTLTAERLAFMVMSEQMLDGQKHHDFAPAAGPWIDVNEGLVGEGAPLALAGHAKHTLTIYVNSWNSFIWLGADSSLFSQGDCQIVPGGWVGAGLPGRAGLTGIG